MTSASATTKSSKDTSKEPTVDTSTSGDGASAAASSKNKDGDSFFQTSKTTRDRDGTHTEKTSGVLGSKDDKATTKKVTSGKEGGATKKDGDEGGVGDGVFAKAGNAFAAAGGAFASAAGGKAVASAE